MRSSSLSWKQGGGETYYTSTRESQSYTNILQDPENYMHFYRGKLAPPKTHAGLYISCRFIRRSRLLSPPESTPELCQFKHSSKFAFYPASNWTITLHALISNQRNEMQSFKLVSLSRYINLKTHKQNYCTGSVSFTKIHT